MDQLEKSLQKVRKKMFRDVSQKKLCRYTYSQFFSKAGGTAAAAGELNKKLIDIQQQYDTAAKQLEEAKEEAKRASTETERLLQLIQMTQEEQNAKEKTIMELQQ
jgi:hypothetical protein